MTPTRVGYRAYMLRLWRAPGARWRASLEDAHTGERRAFATLALLAAYLENLSENWPQASSPSLPANGLDGSSPGPAPEGEHDASPHDSRGL